MDVYTLALCANITILNIGVSFKYYILISLTFNVCLYLVTPYTSLLLIIINVCLSFIFLCSMYMAIGPLNGGSLSSFTFIGYQYIYIIILFVTYNIILLSKSIPP